MPAFVASAATLSARHNEHDSLKVRELHVLITSVAKLGTLKLPSV